MDSSDNPPTGDTKPSGDTKPTGDTKPSGPTNARVRTATILSGIALATLAASALLFLLPVTNPGVQSCGAPAVFLLGATSDRPLVDSDGNLINGWDAEADRDRIQAAQDDPCSSRVARRAVPAGVLLAGFWVLTPTAVIIGWSGRRALRRATGTESVETEPVS